MTPISLSQIETACREYDEQVAALNERISAFNDDLAAVKAKHLAGIKRQAGVVARNEAELTQLVESAPDLFKKPRTAIFHSTKVGFTTSPGQLVFDDEETVIKLIKAKLKDRAEELIRTTEKLNKDAAKRLPATDLARIGCRIDGAGDQVVVKRTDGEVEKLVNKMIEKLVEAVVDPAA